MMKREAPLVAGKERCVALEYEVACVPESGWTLWRNEEKNLPTTKQDCLNVQPMIWSLF
jgi:hypothetical protein